ncbi:MAG: histidine--tRNA ligase [Gammaproteobacteria bacterium]|nr:histidine--tRNA ligase [Pseudomonadales bacterium]MCP5346638.1 histidine--tRNA ligase [Pseudomonadales bacterium]
MAKIQAIRGMNDILPTESPTWQYVEHCFQRVAHRYGYREIRFPVVEQTQLFKRSIGEVTDIVEKEMYSFDDRNGDNLSLRPEGTAGCVRAAEQHGLLYNQQQRLWYHGPMFRHERPQKGRYRQFHQFGIEAFGMPGPDIDAEVILLSANFWQELGIADSVTLELNNIGSAADRRAFGVTLAEFLRAHSDRLDEDSRRRLDSNPLRILDSKVPATRELLADAPVLADFINAESVEHYTALKQLLQGCDIGFVENPRLVRGLDYYNNAVFEWTTSALGAQGTVCAGGRYDTLVEQLGGRSTPGVGFAMGEERLVLLLEELALLPDEARGGVDIYLAAVGDELTGQALAVAETLRQELPGLKLLVNCGGGKYNSQMKKAFNSGARAAIVLELEHGESAPVTAVRLRTLDDAGDSENIALEDLPGRLREKFEFLT